jgi:hypothetical protein
MEESAWRLPGYVVEEPLGAGADARVWRAHVRRGGDPVAVKLLPVYERSQLDAARAEAALLIGLDHPHLVRLHEVVPCRRGLALVLDLAAGGSLADLLASRGRLTVGEVVTAIAPIGAALAYAHNAGVVHGDVSAGNVLFTDVGLPLLADLGVARLIGDDGAVPVCSTPAYVDPAVAAGGVPSPASDVFMLGAVALHALTGEPAWPGTSADAAYAAAARGELGDAAARLDAAGVPQAVAEVVRHALEIDPLRRQSAAEFALDLRHAAEPVALELGAGRARHRAVEPGPDPAVLTHGHRLPPVRTPARTIRGLRPDAPARLVHLGVVTVLLAALLAGMLWWAHGRGGRSAAAADRPPGSPSATVAGAHSVDAVEATALPTSLPSAPAVTQLDAAAAGEVLARLDVSRARAYAQRDPGLLAEVYVPGALRTQDVAQLESIVPAGCGLFGVSTVYSHVAVESRASAQAVVRAVATLRPSTLECGGKPAGRAPAAGPLTLHIALQRVGSGYLISSVTR